MINFIDFPGDKESSFFISRDETQATADMNEWIGSHAISIISIDTIVKEYHFICIRLWYCIEIKISESLNDAMDSIHRGGK